MSLVVDASIVVAALVDEGPNGVWAEGMLTSDDLVAPHLVRVESTNVLRRAIDSGRLSIQEASLAQLDLMALRMQLFPFEPFATRIWELRTNLTAYAAWYVALAEAFGLPLATLDRRLARAPGPRCEFLVPPAA
ncbi:MAG TPA: type II toxin-antitoxin system VapC family toxin [Dehalococcoidia bacterium]|nr:type II toxin-antitoxin system VapC family toxin [Dehalococcoidia bacterium]